MKKDDLTHLNLVKQITQDLWKPELELASSRFHITVAWVAVLLDPVFAFTDYINIPGKLAHLADDTIVRFGNHTFYDFAPKKIFNSILHGCCRAIFINLVTKCLCI